MDVALSIIAGLGLRLAFFSAGSSRLIQAALGLWEGIVIHQVSGRSSAPKMDHVLAFVLRVSLDLLFSKDFFRTFMILAWTALGTLGSEAIYPHAILRAELKKGRDRERRRRHSQSTFSTFSQIPLMSTPLPPRVRAYRHPEQQTPSDLPINPPVQNSTPFLASMPPPTPPSVFLHEQSIIYSPPVKAVEIVQVQQESTQDALPVRPPSGLAQLLERSSDSGSPNPLPITLPTPPESAQSAVPSDGIVEMSRNELRTPRLSTILERTSEENGTPEPNEQEQNGHAVADDAHHPIISGPYAPSATASSAPLPVPNAGLKHTASTTTLKWLASQSAPNNNDASMFIPPLPSSISPVPPVPEALPVRLRHQGSWDAPTPTMNNHIHEFNDQDDQQSEHGSDALYTPGARDRLYAPSDNGYEGDLLRSPPPAELSPLVLNVRSAMTSNEHIPHSDPDIPIPQGQEVNGGYPIPVPPIPHVVEDEDDQFIPGSISQNLLLQPPLPPSGPLIRPASPSPQPSPPHSPATVLSNGSERSTFTTLYPSKLYTRADELRQQARVQEQTRSDLENERRKAEAEGRVLDALALKIKIRDLDAEAQKLHEKAARRYYAARNALQVSSKIDVHGLRPREAFDRAERALLEAVNQKRSSLRIIVGKGNHSVNNQPTLKPTLLRELSRLGFQCEVDSRNAGVLIVTIPQQAPSTSNESAGPSRR